MVEDFLNKYIKKIVQFPDSIQIEKTMSANNLCEIVILAKGSDVGRLIGKDGKMINAIKTFISAYKAKDGISYKLTIKEQKC